MGVKLLGHPCVIPPSRVKLCPNPQTRQLEPEPYKSMILKVGVPKPPRQPQMTANIVKNTPIDSVKRLDNISKKRYGDQNQVLQRKISLARAVE